MPDPSDLERFVKYATTFELAQAADAWTVLEPLFADDAVHVVHHGGSLGGDDRGRAAVIEGLRRSVLDHDRRFDVRIPEILEGPITRPDGIWMRYALTLRRGGLADLRFEGEHLTRFADGRIQWIEEWLPEDTPERVGDYLAEHDDRLRPAESPPSEPTPLDRAALEAAGARSLVHIYGSAKSEQDIGAALAVCHEDFVLETVPFGTRASGRAEAAAQLEVFFGAFPDYAVELEGLAHGDATAAWGRVRLSLRGDFLGLAPTLKTADLPVFCVFDVADGQLSRERFFFDGAELAQQLDLAPTAFSDALAAATA
jgi:predicted ester cyclase